MTTPVQLVVIFAVVWVLRTAIAKWANVRLREAEIANRRVDLEFDQFEMLKEHQKASRGLRLANLTAAPMPGFRRSPDELS